MEVSVRQIPVFAFPTNLKFYVGSRQSHKQLLTVYNPYDYKVKYKVLCTTPNKYTVIDPEGSIAPQSCIDLVVRHTMPVSANCNIVDKFRISMYDHVTKQFLGKRDVESRLLPGEPDTVSNDGDNFHSLPHTETSFEDQIRTSTIPLASHLQQSFRSNPKANFFALFIAAICVGLLMLPTKFEPPEESYIPAYLHLTLTFKLGVAYTLGMMTTVIFRH